MAWRKVGQDAWQGKTVKPTVCKVPKGGANLVKGSKQQEAIWKELVEGNRHIMVKALAGTGKTFTVIEGFKRLLDSGRSDCRTKAFLAFNKSIAMELQKKVPPGVQACTCHSLMFRSLQDSLGRKDVNDDKTLILLEAAVGGEAELWALKRRDPTIVGHVKKLVGLVKGTLLGFAADDDELGLDEGEILQGLPELAEDYSIDLNGSAEEVFKYTARIVMMSADNDASEGRIDYDDMIWLPIVHDVRLPSFDLLCVDESQDLNRCQQEAILRMGKRIMLVGDENQSIYGFRGADIDSMKNMEEALKKTKRKLAIMPLTMTRRCPKTHVAMAKQIVPAFEAMKEAPEGVVEVLPDAKVVEVAQPGDLVICRTNAPVVGMAFRLISAGVKANIQGRDLGQGLLATIRKLTGRDEADVDFLLDRLEDYEHKETKRINAKKNPSQSQLAALQDKCDCIRCLCNGLDRVSQVRQRVDELFMDIQTGGEGNRNFVLLSSVHRAKGLEADTVFILEPEKMPHPMAKGKDVFQEMNIKYVALTRSKSRMVLVPGQPQR